MENASAATQDTHSQMETATFHQSPPHQTQDVHFGAPILRFALNAQTDSISIQVPHAQLSLISVLLGTKQVDSAQAATMATT